MAEPSEIRRLLEAMTPWECLDCGAAADIEVVFTLHLTDPDIDALSRTDIYPAYYEQSWPVCGHCSGSRWIERIEQFKTYKIRPIQGGYDGRVIDHR